jgi:hypothetical protein
MDYVIVALGVDHPSGVQDEQQLLSVPIYGWVYSIRNGLTRNGYHAWQEELKLKHEPIYGSDISSKDDTGKNVVRELCI